jgi:lysine biosynthesis protein LysW
MPLTYCPSCDALIGVDKPRMGAIFKCRECGAELEVVSTHPFEIYFPFDESWDDERDDEWDNGWEEGYGKDRKKAIKRKKRAEEHIGHMEGYAR